MRVCVVGAGLAGSLLTWRLVRATTWRIDLVRGKRDADATAASGGAVRGYETDPELRRLATASMVELLASRTLRGWAGYRPTGSLYLRPAGTGVSTELADIDAVLPGSASVVAGRELAGLGVAVPDGVVAVRERLAGYVSPAGLRDAVLRDPVIRRRVRVLPAEVGAIVPDRDGAIGCDVDGERRGYDVVVLATGPWTPAVLRANDLPADAYRTRSIQYCLHTAGDWRPPQFVDELTGAYGRPTTDGGLLLGVPTERWDVDPDRPAVRPELPAAAAALAASRFPRLRLGPAGRTVSAADCYTEWPGLALRPVLAGGHRLFTFTGGSGGSAKTVLAASQRAAVQLTEPAS
ncbi:MAG TPA: FAD-dependent oxidoreductase, partial [Micromonosporaceae bacterium]|jgi:glycine/D-amino acid oxidase-like deaminating enzyme|nr:FAD-dependent oxidoreductase [Micromonosporaceae bacterium]